MHNMSLNWPFVEFEVFFLNPILLKKKEIDYIYLTELQASILRGEKEWCKDNETCPISEIAPDLTVYDFHENCYSYESLNIDRDLGRGAYATVKRGEIQGIGEVAVKELDTKIKNAHVVFQEYHKELLTMNKLQHENIIRLIGVCLDPIAMIIELAPGGALDSFLHGLDTFPLILLLRIAVDIAKGLYYMHSLLPPIAHLDVKSPNILLSSFDAASKTPCAKVTDFGTCEPVTGKLHGRVVANPIWSAPEILNENPNGYDQRCDIYAYGVTLWELMSREEPWSEMSFWGDISDAVLEGGRPEIPNFWPKGFVDLMELCWAQDPDKRPNWEWTILELQNLGLNVEEMEQQTAAPRKQQLEKRIQENARREEERLIEEERRKKEAEQAVQLEAMRAQQIAHDAQVAEMQRKKPNVKLKKMQPSDKPFKEAIFEESSYLNFEKWLGRTAANPTELLNKLKFYWQVINWEKTCHSSVEERREEANNILARFFGPKATNPLPLAFEMDTTSQECFQVIIPFIEPTLDQRWCAFQEYLERLEGKDIMQTKKPTRMSSKISDTIRGSKRGTGDTAKIRTPLRTINFNHKISTNPEYMKAFAIYLSHQPQNLTPLLRLFLDVNTVMDSPAFGTDQIPKSTIDSFLASTCLDLLGEDVQEKLEASQDDHMVFLDLLHSSCLKILEPEYVSWEVTNSRDAKKMKVSGVKKLGITVVSNMVQGSERK
eukprot:TRINITY_DN11208_c0_g1_i1.p1 TRINITY_DN11208_c0_g1~~TRINITY_DN11208_c0_g1_i1.p1  ORF type:complete len:716 (-),score=172.59 TRINITY_DN11208_c0_g1_i1:152-2299(-)